MISRSDRPGHSRDNASVPPLARAIMLRAKRPMISVEIRLRLATDTPCLEGGEGDPSESVFSRKRCLHTILKADESGAGKQEIAAESGFNQPGGVKSVEPGKPGVVMRQMAGQGAQVTLGRDDFGKA